MSDAALTNAEAYYKETKWYLLLIYSHPEVQEMKNQLAAREVDDSILRLPETDNIIECSTQRKNKSPTYTLGSSEAIKINAV